MIRDGEWQVLANKLRQGLSELPAVIPPAAVGHLSVISQTIATYIDSIFTKDPDLPDETKRWMSIP